MSRLLKLVFVAVASAVMACERPTASNDSPDTPDTPPDTLRPPSGNTAIPRSVAFVSDRNGSPHIYLADADGGAVRLLSQGEAPAWSNDAYRLAFHRPGSDEDRPSIYIVSVYGTYLRTLGPGTEPAWSPDDRQIVFNGDGGLFVVNSDGSGTPRMLLSDAADLPRPPWYDPDDFGPGWVERPSWSPDGSRIAFVYVAPFSVELGAERNAYVMNADGTGLRLLSGWCDISPPGQGVLPCPSTSPAWSPNSELVTVVTSDFNPATGSLDVALASIGAGGWDERTVHYRGYKGYIGRPSWSRDGGRIVFDQPASPSPDDGRLTRIFSMSIATGAVRRLVGEVGGGTYLDIDAVMARWPPGVSDTSACRGCWDY